MREMLLDWQRGHSMPFGQRNSSSACLHSASVSKSTLRTGNVIFGRIVLPDLVVMMAKRKASKLSDKQLAKRVFSPAVRQQLKEALAVLETGQKPEKKEKKR